MNIKFEDFERQILRATPYTAVISTVLPGMAIMNFALLFWTFVLIIFNILAIKFLYCCFAPGKNCSEVVENTLEGFLFSFESLMDKTNKKNTSLQSALSWRNCLKDKYVAFCLYN